MPYVAHSIKENDMTTEVTIKAGKGTVWTLARLKGIAGFIGSMLTLATTLMPLPGDPHYWTGAAALLTAASVYAVPNIQATGKRALLDPDGNPVTS